MSKKKKKKAKAERERMLAAYRPTDIESRETYITYRVVPVAPDEPTGTFLSGGGVTMKLNPNATWDESTAEMSSFLEQVIARRIADAIRSIR